MVVASAGRFLEEQTQLAEWSKAVAHPARIAILQFIARRNTCICGEIVDELPLAQSTVSQHLKELERVGLIKGEIEGTKVCYCLDRETILQFQRSARELFEILTRDVPLECC